MLEKQVIITEYHNKVYQNPKIKEQQSIKIPNTKVGYTKAHLMYYIIEDWIVQIRKIYYVDFDVSLIKCFEGISGIKTRNI